MLTIFGHFMNPLLMLLYLRPVVNKQAVFIKSSGDPTWGTYCCTRSLRLKHACIQISCMRSKKHIAQNGYFLTSKKGGVTLVWTNRRREQGRGIKTKKGASCLLVRGNAANAPTIGKTFSNIHFGRSSSSTKKFALLCFFRRALQNVPKRSGTVHAHCNTMHSSLSKWVWQVCPTKSVLLLLRSGGVSPKTCAN